ncbi:MAG: N-acetylmuramoyl-L-alanine amidase, partial [Candidatus Omnitrophica bacterium]|nr:N-acetylmuramoyl-L-alanine amidase [Candidatus Omnitrophota bacterium]
MNTNRNTVFGIGVALSILTVLIGCSALREDDATELTYAEPKLPPLSRPKVVETNRFLGTLPSGRLYDLVANKIAIAALPDFNGSSDPKTYLNNVVRREKSRGSSYLPYHFYISPSGDIFHGQSESRCGYLEGQLVRDSFLVGIMGDYNQPTNFMPEPQQMAMIQLCAWLCYENSIDSRNIIPATQLSPEAEPLGENLANWFGPTQTLRS